MILWKFLFLLSFLLLPQLPSFVIGQGDLALAEQPLWACMEERVRDAPVFTGLQLGSDLAILNSIAPSLRPLLDALRVFEHYIRCVVFIQCGGERVWEMVGALIIPKCIHGILTNELNEERESHDFGIVFFHSRLFPTPWPALGMQDA